ncbi:tannase/feruloyl esterase family alpha/beta hydrolase [Sphaerisporangium perillae]|uniref:tannase/feruloyl esterase family alpha/beta hydrolase n=1 Tax=Sphaerisporangium perillae TaxID=2935860 RepID=UPI00200E832D|nr:tannase/feruloyl esterase family alpha/beta hydrolase [Sphaerisporangium perillae]
MLGVLLLIGAGAFGPSASASSATAGTSAPVRTCASLQQVTFTDGTKVTSTDDTTVTGVCRVNLVVPEQINIGVSLPTTGWNGRFVGVGGGGYVGSVTQAGDLAALSGYAAAVTDTGHTGSLLDGSWAWSATGMRTNLIQDFAYRSLHEMTVKGKAVTQAFYGRSPAYSYWNGCSTGGRQGLMEAQRYPDDYDGIVSGAPAINWDRFVPSGLWPQVVMREMGDVLPSCKQEAFTQAAVTACDGADGVVDGIVANTACRFDPAWLIGRQTGCGTITATDAAVMKKIWQGPRSKDGSFLWYGLTPGTGLSSLAGSVNGVQTPFPIVTSWFQWWLAKDPGFDWTTVTTDNFAQYFEQSREEYNSVLGTDNPDLSGFRDSRGKIIIWHGEADSLIFPQGSIDYYQRVVQQMGGLSRTENFARLFLAPGVDHCGGGSGAAPTDPLSAVVNWVEKGQAPQTLPAATTNSTITRPLCTWPEVARYKGYGDSNDASSFRCLVNPLA